MKTPKRVFEAWVVACGSSIQRDMVWGNPRLYGSREAALAAFPEAIGDLGFDVVRVRVTVEPVVANTNKRGKR